MGKWLLGIGLFLAALGALLIYVPNAFSWLGKLPGDIRIESDQSGVYIPITSMVLLSIVLSVVVAVFKRIP